MAAWVSNKGKQRLMQAGLSTLDLRLMYADTAPASEAALQDLNFLNQVTTDEVAGTTRADLASITATEDDSANVSILDAADPANLTGLNGPTVAGAYLYEYNASDSAAAIIAWLGCTPVVTNGGDVTVQINTNGLLRAA